MESGTYACNPSGPLQINASISISSYGSGGGGSSGLAVFDCKQTVQALVFVGANVTLNGLSFLNGYGPAVSISDAPRVRISNCQFVRSLGDSLTIKAYTADLDWQISGCLFLDNRPATRVVWLMTGSQTRSLRLVVDNGLQRLGAAAVRSGG